MTIQVLDEAVGNLVEQPYSHIMVRNRPLDSTLHKHTFYEVILLISGTVHHQLNGVNHTLGNGDLVFINPDDTHWYTYNSVEIELLSLQVAREEMRRFLQAYGIEGMLADMHRPCFITIPGIEARSIADGINRIVGRSPDAVLQIYRILLGNIMHCYLNYRLNSDLPPWLQLAMGEMCTIRNAAEGVPAFLRLSNLSHAQLCRLMKKHCGITPQQYVRDLRLSLARQMIMDTDIDFLSISMEVGYNSFSHFCSTFKEKFGLSPSGLRRQARVRLSAEIVPAEDED